MTLTIIRTHVGGRALCRPLEAIVGQDISEGEAEQLVSSGDAEPGPEYQLPPAVYLLRAITIGGVLHPEGKMLIVGQEITEAQALALLRGMHSGRGGGVVSAPGGGIG